MVFTEQQLQVKKLVDVQQDIEIDALNDGVGALSSTMQNGFTEAANNFSDIQNSLGLMNSLSDERYNGITGSINALSNAMTQGFLDIGNTVANVAGEIQGQLNQMNANTGNMNDNIQGQFNDVNNYVGGFENNVNTALQGIQNTFYYMENDYHDRFNQVNTNIGDSINNFHNEISNDLYVKVFSADTMIYNVSATPVNSLTALGYDSNGKIIPVTVIANTNIQFPPNANYLYTDVAGTAFGGTADTEVNTNNNLITSYAVYNAVNDIWTDLNEFHNEVSNAFGDVQNSFNAVDDTLAGVQNQFNDVNNAHNTLYQNVVDGFIDVWANFDSVNNNISNMNSSIQNQFNDVNNNIQNQFNDVNNNISEIDNTLYSVMDGLGITTPMNYINSTSPVNYQAVETVVFTKGTTGNLWSPSSLLGNKYYDWNSTTNTLTFSSPTGLIFFNSNMVSAFLNCTKLNHNIQILNGVTSLGAGSRFSKGAFAGCTSLNQNIHIPNSVEEMGYAFAGCTSLNQNIQLPPNLNIYTSFAGVFDGCTSLNQNILLTPKIVTMTGTFRNCTSLNQNILIPSSVTTLDNTFYGCTSLNQDIYIYSDVLNSSHMSNSFSNCPLLATHNIHIRSTIPMDVSNGIYNCLVNNTTGINWTGRIYNDLPAPTTWPPAN